jgi:transposase
MKIARIGLDLAKNVFQVQGMDEQERVVLRRSLTRVQLAGHIEKRPPA